MAEPSRTVLPAVRHGWMDVLRGVSILLVTLNHSILNASDKYGSVPHVVVTVNEVLEPVRMPTMVFLSGMLLSKSLTKGRYTYLDGKVRSLLWPFLVWTCVALIFEGSLGYVRGEGLSIPNPFVALVDPLGHTWFLQYLFIFYMIALAAGRIPPLAISASALVAGFVLDGDWNRFLTLLAFFMLGKWVAEHSNVLRPAVYDRWVLVAAAGGAAALVGITFAGFDVTYESASVPLVLALGILAIRAAQAVEGHRFVRPLRYVGERSIVFYLTHGYVVLLGVAIGMKLTGNGLVAVAVAFSAGVMASTIMAMGYDRFAPVRLLYELPKKRASAPAA